MSVCASGGHVIHIRLLSPAVFVSACQVTSDAHLASAAKWRSVSLLGDVRVACRIKNKKKICSLTETCVLHAEERFLPTSVCGEELNGNSYVIGYMYQVEMDSFSSLFGWNKNTHHWLFGTNCTSTTVPSILPELLWAEQSHWQLLSVRTWPWSNPLLPLELDWTYIVMNLMVMLQL